MVAVWSASCAGERAGCMSAPPTGREKMNKEGEGDVLRACAFSSSSRCRDMARAISWPQNEAGARAAAACNRCPHNNENASREEQKGRHRWGLGERQERKGEVVEDGRLLDP